MRCDPIVEEVRRICDEFAKEHRYDLKKIVVALQREEAESGRPLTPLPPKRNEDEHPNRKAG